MMTKYGTCIVHTAVGEKAHSMLNNENQTHSLTGYAYQLLS